MKILVVEDNPDIVANLCDYLGALGYTVEAARNGLAGLAMASRVGFDAIVLDLGLPGMDGLEVCRHLRSDMRQATPVLMLTARDALDDKVLGFECGADDYLVKPFSMVELNLRLKALVRRGTGATGPSILRFADTALDLSNFEATRAGVKLRLTPTGYRILEALLRQAPGLVPREVIERAVWGDDRPDSDALRTHIHSLRLALDKPFRLPLLKTVPGIGYRLEKHVD